MRKRQRKKPPLLQSKAYFNLKSAAHDFKSKNGTPFQNEKRAVYGCFYKNKKMSSGIVNADRIVVRHTARDANASSPPYSMQKRVVLAAAGIPARSTEVPNSTGSEMNSRNRKKITMGQTNNRMADTR